MEIWLLKLTRMLIIGTSCQDEFREGEAICLLVRFGINSKES